MATVPDKEEDRGSSSSSGSRSSWYMVQDTSSTVIDIGDSDDLQSEGNGVMSFESPAEGSPSKRTGPISEKEFMERIRERMASEVGGYVWTEGTKSAKRAFNLYANIDILRPYFDVEPNDVRNRLLYSLVPKLPSAKSPQTVAGELYGPLMLVFTLIAVLLFGMKTSEHIVQEGTLMGTAFGLCFGYWLGGSAFCYCVSYFCNTHLTFLQILSLTGYALFGTVMCLFLTTIGYHHSHSFFYALLFVFGGLSALKLVSVYISRTWNYRHGVIAGCIVAAVHLLFLLYLHFAFHSVYEDLHEEHTISQGQLSRHVRDTLMPTLEYNFGATQSAFTRKLADLSAGAGAPAVRVARSINATLARATVSVTM